MGRVSENDIIAKYQKEFKTHFKTSSFFTVIAPGRINIIGEHTDYNLGLAMPIAINRWICTVISLREDNNINIYASNFDEHISLSMDDLDTGNENWEKYIFGCIKVFIDQYDINKGFDILIGGNVPIGFGMSSSAALEVSLLGALFYTSGILIDRQEILKLANKVEKDFLGIQSGMLDQYASIFSKKDNPLLIDFSALSHSYVKSNINRGSWVLINSMVDRPLADSKYNERVSECNLALKEINKTNEIDIKINELTIQDLEKIKDSTILYNRIFHVLSENKRVQSMRIALEQGDLILAGNILSESHDSLANNYEVSCKEIDGIVNIAKSQKGFYGGRIMGGGFGGCCLALVEDSKQDLFIDTLLERFYNDFKYNLEIEFIDFSNGLTFI